MKRIYLISTTCQLNVTSSFSGAIHIIPYDLSLSYNNYKLFLDYQIYFIYYHYSSEIKIQKFSLFTAFWAQSTYILFVLNAEMLPNSHVEYNWSLTFYSLAKNTSSCSIAELVMLIQAVEPLFVAPEWCECKCTVITV